MSEPIDRRDMMRLAAAAGLVSLTGANNAEAGEGQQKSSSQDSDMNRRVSDAIKATREAYQKISPNKSYTDEDFSYITADLLTYYDKYAQEKDYERVKMASKAGLTSSLPKARLQEGTPAFETWTFYGHHVILNGGTGKATFTNDNASNGPDSPSNMCWGYNVWTANWSMASPPQSCPSNSQGYGSRAHGIR